MATVTLSQLSCRYGAYKAVDGVNLVVRDGEALSLLGPEGSGKSTALRLIAGLVDPTAGSIALDGRVVSSGHGSVPPERRGMAMLFHSTALWPHLSAFENVAFGLRGRHADSGARARSETMLAAVGLSDAARKRPQQLSLPDRQRLALARALVVEPQLLLLDDAFGTLNPAERIVLAQLARKLAAERRLTLISVSNDAQEAMVLADRVAVFNRGRLEQVDTPGGLYMHPETRVVASAMGRALLLDGQRRGKVISCAGLQLDATRVERGIGRDGAVVVCLRPEHLKILAAGDAAPQAWASCAGVIERRTFRGAHWDYAFAPTGSTLMLEVAAPNTQVFAAGNAVTLAVDPARAVVVR